MEDNDCSEPYSWMIFTTLNFFLQPFSLGILIALSAMILLLICSALISGAEVAYFSLNPSNFEWLRNSENKSSRIILDLLERPKQLLATILITNNFVNVAIIILSTYIALKQFNFSQYPVLAFVLQVIAVTFLILMIGEVIPKVYATQHAVKLAGFMAYPILFLDKILSPVSNLLISSTSIIHKKIEQKIHSISIDELSDVLEITSEEALREEHKILKGIVEFGNTDVKQIMKARVDITAIDYEIPYKKVITTILDCGFSRIPVYKENFDNIAGILYIKDLLPFLSEKENFRWQSLISSPFFVPENKKIDNLLKEFQEKKIHLAIVVDEYGGTSGIVTLEDIIEEIVGEISDEFDTGDLVYSKLDERNYVFEGKTPLNDLCRIIGIEGNFFEQAKGDSDSLAGFILELVGKIPEKDERITFENFVFAIEAVDQRRIKRVKVTIAD
ncbi:MAG: gliding motility-associated protein GldE [Bacteroidota bacterium]